MPRIRKPARQRLVEAIGEAATARLIRKLGATTIRVPSPASEKRLARNRRIIDALRHKSYSAVARQFGLHRSTVIRASKQHDHL